MKKLLFAFAALLIFSSCTKVKDIKNKKLVYYAADYKEKDVGFYNIDADEIEAVWVDFSQKGEDKKYNRYTLNVKSNGNVIKTMGDCTIDWNNKITFIPDSGDTYIGSWTYGKEKYAITYDLDSRTESITFVYKEQEHCKKHK